MPDEGVCPVVVLLVGAGAADIVPPVEPGAMGDIVLEGAGAGFVLPDAMPGAAVIGAFAELSGAGEDVDVWADAKPNEHKTVNAANDKDRIASSS